MSPSQNRTRLAEQRKWIEQCEADGRSYAGEKGQTIREADQIELLRLRWQTGEVAYEVYKTAYLAHQLKLQNADRISKGLAPLSPESHPDNKGE